MKNLFLKGKNLLKEKISDNEFKIWFADLTYNKFDKNCLYLHTANFFKKEKILLSYKKLLQHIFCDLSDDIKDIAVSYERSADTGAAQKDSFLEHNSPEYGSGNIKSNQAAAPANSAHITVKDGLKEQYRFDNYLVADFNRLCYDFTDKLISNISRISPFYIYGGVGTGKTHIIQAIGNYIKKNYPFFNIKYITPNEFVSDFTKALKNKTDREFRLKYRQLDCLLLDDIQFFAGKEKSSIEFFHIFNEIFVPGKQMVFCSDMPPDELNDIDERLKSRLSSSVIVELNRPEFADRKKLISFFLKQYNITIEKKIIDFLAANLPGDVRKINGAVITLASLQHIYKKDIDEAYCRKHIRQLIAARDVSNIPAERIIFSVANYASIPWRDLKSRKRSRNISYYRHIIIYLLKKYGNLSFPEIGNYLGGKTAGAVHNGYHTVEKGLKESAALNDVINSILQKF